MPPCVCELQLKMFMCAGWEFDAVKGHCKAVGTTMPAIDATATDLPVIGGQGKYRYQYMPDLLVPPVGNNLIT